METCASRLDRSSVERVLQGYDVVVDGSRQCCDTLKLTRNPACPFCGEAAERAGGTL